MAVINYVAYQVIAFVAVSYLSLALTNTLAFYTAELITAVKSSMIQAPGMVLTKTYKLITSIVFVCQICQSKLCSLFSP
jgi:hypothetical protein